MERDDLIVNESYALNAHHSEEAGKKIRKNILKGNLELELYNLEEDLQELHNLAGEHPDMVQQMKEIMEQEHTSPELGRFRMKALDEI